MSEVMVVPMARTRMSNNPPVKARGKGFFDVVKSVGKAVAPIAVDAGTKYLKKRISGGASPYVSGAYSEAMDRHSAGGGFFDVVKSVGKAVAPMAVDLGRKMIKDKYGFGIDLSQAQMRSLKKGGAIQINPRQILEQGKQLLQLLPQSAKKLIGALKKNKGMRLMLKEGEDVIDKLTGGSIFGSIFKAVAPALIDAGASFVGKKLSGRGAGGGIYPAGTRGRGFLGDLVKQYAPQAKKYAQQYAPMAVDAGAKYLNKKIRGDGMFDIIKSVGKAVAPIAVDAGSKYLKKRLGGGIYPAGSGFMPAGGAMPIQLGSPYQSVNSPAMNPFVGTTGLSGYAPITAGANRSGGSMLPMDRGVGRIMRPRIGSNPATYTPEYISMR